MTEAAGLAKLKQRLARLERVVGVHTEAEADGVVVYMPWEDRSRALAAMRDALQHQPHELIDVHGMAIALLCWGEGVTPHDLVLSLLGDGPGSDRIVVHKTALITLPHAERVKQIPSLCKRLGWEPPARKSANGDPTPGAS
jgi:hypothetical protein